jgi:hypothetical protein
MFDSGIILKMEIFGEFILFDNVKLLIKMLFIFMIIVFRRR